MTDNRAAWTRYYESTLSTRQQKREASGSAASKVRVVQSEKQAPIVLRGAEKQIAEDNAQFRRYLRAKAAQYREAMGGSSKEIIRNLHTALKALDLDCGDALITLVSTTDWQSIDIETRYAALSMIDDAIARLREQNGLAPFDDSIFDEDPTVFEICKARIGVP